MTEQETTWVFDRDSIFKTLGFSRADQKILKNKGDDFVSAIVEVSPPETIEVPENTVQGGLTSAPLYITGVRYHLNLTQSWKAILISAVSIVAKFVVLQNQKMLETSVALSSIAIVELIKNLTVLSDRQREILDAILELKRARNDRKYWPTTDEISEKL